MMGGLGDENDGAEGDVVFRDVITLALCGFVAVVIMMLPHLHPPGKKQESDAEPPGNVLVELRWPDDNCADVDLWVQAPGDIPVGYSNKGGQIFNLLRDDLGCRSAGDTLNLETVYSRGFPPGEYTINAHLYRLNGGTLPVPLNLSVGVKASSTSSTKDLLYTNAELTREGQEITLVRFKLDKDGALVPGSMHNLQRNLRAAAQ